MRNLLVRALFATANSSSPSQFDYIPTTSGKVTGHIAHNTTDTVHEYLGIRYARAPVGDLRFAAPQPYIAPNSTINATSWFPHCPFNIPPVTKFNRFDPNGFEVYNTFTAHSPWQADQAEDCLALNVWTKAAPGEESGDRPVFVFFHGGRFQIPGPHSPFYVGKYFAGDQDVVVVTISYRLGMFGFSGAPGVEQNAALRDQRLAVEWVRDNIAGFGGDPSRIIIHGQSVGGFSTDAYLYAYPEDPIVAGAIAHSGTVFSFLPNTPEYSRSLYYNVSGTLGCGQASTPETTILACLRSKNVSEILNAARTVPALPSQALAQATFHPTVDNKTVWADWLERSRAGKFARVPYLAGNADYEAGFYRVSGFAVNSTLSPAAWELFTERGFTCPAKYSTDLRKQFDVPTWRYRYMGDWPNLRLFEAYDGFPDSGAYHGSELTLLFNTTYGVTGSDSPPGQQAAARYIRQAWAAFGRDPKRGLTDFGWPEYGSSSGNLVRLSYNNTPGLDLTNPFLYDSACPPVEQNDPLPGRGGF
ncbi:cholinesterase precursor [Paraphaeosphaeria sporulosa]|uniref:Cholinesterase n=1 Tax=Paraphaeosphaeria sporulosa TaxID=1460663 RepID=A0A177CXB6_9PLEO|nr:cholinesterase precursor [Paraphaeosphaeria sporulosa]OAG12173.1 cholinesterase precursor [Paraphaeosphaeria sporulosa]